MNKSLIVTGICSLIGGFAFWLIPHLQGCAAVSGPVADPKPSIADVAGVNKAVADDIGNRATSIDASTSGINSKTPSTLKPVFGPFLNTISTQTAGLREDQGKLETTQTQLTQASADVTGLQTQVKDLTTANQKLTAANQSALRFVMMLLIGLSVLGVAASAGLVYLGNLKVAIPLAIACVTTLVLSIIVSSYAVWLAIGGGIILLGGIGYLIYQAVTNKNALVQTVKTAEAAKMTMTDHARLFTFGNGPVTGQAHVIQSPKTQALVAAVRGQVTKAVSVPQAKLATAA
jgi:hypothetical protein